MLTYFVFTSLGVICGNTQDKVETLLESLGVIHEVTEILAVNAEDFGKVLVEYAKVKSSENGDIN